MSFLFEEHLVDSPFVQRVWRTHSAAAGTFTSVAVPHWELVFWTQEGRTQVSLRGPETRASTAPIPAEAEFMGIQFGLGSFLTRRPPGLLLDAAQPLPPVSQRTFQLLGVAWALPDFEYADVFVDRLVRRGLLRRDPLVQDALDGQALHLSARSVQRRFLRATGLSLATVRQIERAKRAATLLEGGLSIADVVDQAGYADQSHLTRSLRRVVGHTPAQLVRTRDG